MLILATVLLIGRTFVGKSYADPLPAVDEGGTLSSDETWTSGYVYVVDSPVTVANGYTLTIDPGAIVKYVNDDSYNYIDVQSGGTLDAAGTSENPVIFTSYLDDTQGGDTNGDGDATSPAAGDYPEAIYPDGGTIDVTYSDFSYATEDIGNVYELDTNSNNSILTVTNSSFTNSDRGVSLGGSSDTVTLQDNNFALSTPGDGNDLAIYANESDLTGIDLSGADENTFSGSGPNIGVEVSGGVPADEYWTIGSGPVLVVGGGVDATVTVDGTVDIDPGAIVKTVNEDDNVGFDVESDGTLNATGTSDNPIVFTSYLDDSISGDINGDGDDTSAAPGDYGIAIRYEEPGDSDVVSYAVFKYATSAISIGQTGSIGVDHTQFTDNEGAFAADTTSWTDETLGSLADVCPLPYDNSINLTDDWFGSSGIPGVSTDLSSYIDQTMPGGYSGLSELYDSASSIYGDSYADSDGDNTIPYSIWTCGIPDTDTTIGFPITPVNVIDLIYNPGINSGKLWAADNLYE